MCRIRKANIFPGISVPSKISVLSLQEKKIKFVPGMGIRDHKVKEK